MSLCSVPCLWSSAEANRKPCLYLQSVIGSRPAAIDLRLLISPGIAESRRLDLEILDAISELDWQDSGYPHLWTVLVHALRISPTAAKRHVRQVELVCPKVGVTRAR